MRLSEEMRADGARPAQVTVDGWADRVEKMELALTEITRWADMLHGCPPEKTLEDVRDMARSAFYKGKCHGEG